MGKPRPPTRYARPGCCSTIARITLGSCGYLTPPRLISAPPVPTIYTRALQRLRRRPSKPFKFPAVYQPLPISIARGRCGERIALSELGGGQPRLRRNLRPERADDGYAYGGRDADQKMPHSSNPARVPEPRCGGGQRQWIVSVWSAHLFRIGQPAGNALRALARTAIASELKSAA
jgi:hypothetical protein